MKIVTVIGARPQFIKAAMCSRAFSEDGIKELIVHTGQHFDANMSEVFFDELSIPKPAHNLGIGGGSHGQNTGRMIEAIEQVLVSEKTGFWYMGTQIARWLQIWLLLSCIFVAHVEAGLRSFNRKMPEEINRILTDHAANLLFAPTRLHPTLGK